MRVPPQNREAERSVIGSVILDPSVLPLVKARLRAESFYFVECREGYEAILRVVERGDPVDLLAVANEVNKVRCTQGDLVETLGSEFFVPSAANVETYVGIVAETAARREALGAATEGMKRFHDQTEDAAEGIRWLIGKLEEVEKRGAGLGAFDLGAAVAEAESSLSHGDGQWSTGIEWLDGITGKLAPGQCWVIGGRSQHCKTALCLWIALQRLEEGGKVTMLRYEESSRAMLLRLAAMLTGVPVSDVWVGGGSEADRDRYVDALRSLPGRWGRRLAIHSGANVPQVEAAIDAERPHLVVYDTIQAMSTQVGRRKDRRDLEIGDMCGLAARLALRYHHAALVVSQLRKSVCGLPTMTDLRESGAIEEAADIALLAWWPFIEKGSALCQEERAFCVVSVGKNRVTGNKPVTVCRLDAGIQKFGQALAPQEADEFLAKMTGQQRSKASDGD